MRLKMLVATIDTEYAKLLSDNISEYHADIIEVSVCSTLKCLSEAVAKRRYDVALLDAALIEGVDMESIRLPLLLWSEHEIADNVPPEIGKIQKYQRISSIVATTLERYATIAGRRQELDSKVAEITAVWSPAGGVGTTTVALAYAYTNVSEDKEVFYLNLENFSCTPAYFTETGKSISAVFEMLDNQEGDVKLLVQGICRRESGITYLCSPNNFDDISILSSDNIQRLVTACAELADELVIDLSCTCDERTRRVFEIADKVLIVTEPSSSVTAKLTQFTSQNNVFESIKGKATLVANKGATPVKPPTDSIISLPLIQSGDATAVYKALSQNFKIKS